MRCGCMHGGGRPGLKQNNENCENCLADHAEYI